MEKKLARDGITIRNNHHVERVSDGFMYVKEQGIGTPEIVPSFYDDLPHVMSVPFGMLVWSTGLASNPLVQNIKDARKDERTGR